MKRQDLKLIFLLIVTLQINQIQLQEDFTINPDPTQDTILPDECLAEFRDAVLNAHNEYREQHGSPPLKSNSSMDGYTQFWSRYLAHINVIKHTEEESLGENVFYKYGQKLSSITDCGGKKKEFLHNI
jgi:uncharacterized protein YkwD